MTKDIRQYRILVVEDNPGDLLIVEDFLAEQILLPKITHVDSFRSASMLLNSDGCQFDVILLDLSLVDKNGEELITEILQLAGSCPVIILTGYADIAFSRRSISKGILDYLLKEDLTSLNLYKSIIYAIERKKINTALIESEKRYSDLFQLSPQPMCLYDNETFQFIQVNKAAIEHYNYTNEEFLDLKLMDIIPDEEKENAIKIIVDQQRQINHTYKGQFKNCKKNGEIIDVDTYSTPLIINNKPTTLVIGIDVTEKNLYQHMITKAIIKTQEDERYEIGGELHDNVCQLLAVSQFSLAMLKKTLTAPLMVYHDQCKENITHALNEIRNISHRLAPAFFGDATLEEAFRRLTESFNIEGNYDISLFFDKAIKRAELTLELQLNLYRILQEQLKNIAKYAKATLITIEVLIYNHKLKMRIQDDGIGCDQDKIKAGIGMANMKRRAELFAGKFNVYSSTGEGCEIIIDIPLSSSVIIEE